MDRRVRGARRRYGACAIVSCVARGGVDNVSVCVCVMWFSFSSAVSRRESVFVLGRVAFDVYSLYLLMAARGSRGARETRAGER